MLSGLGEFNRGTLLFLGELTRWQIGLLIVIAIGIWGLTWLDLRDLGRARRATLLALRAAALGLVLLLVLEPALELKHVSVVRNHVAVLVDTSESQALSTGDGSTRIERARDLLERMRPIFGTPDEEHIYDLFSFDRELAELDPDDIGELPMAATGDATHILETVEAVVDRFGRRELGGIVVISDGVDNGLLGARMRRGESLDAETLEALAALDVPIHTFATAEPGEIRDVAVERVLYDDFAFVRNAVSVVVELRVLGFDGETLPITLSREGVPLRQRNVEVLPGRSRYRVQFEFVPELIGKEIYSVETPLREGEAVSENNREFFVLKVIRDKIRILQVVGRPSWDVRFLRQLLKGNPNVDLISFFILRTQDDLHRGSDDELSLIPFPTDELFNEQLGSFDLIIFQNFDYGPYSMRQYLPLVREYVRSGGGFAMIGGDLSFASGGYAVTELAAVLPVGLPAGTDPRTLIDESSFRPVLTDAGSRHPLTRLTFGQRENAELWRALPTMRGTNVVLEAREGAVVLATHPRLQAGEAPMPVLAVSDVEEGRSMAMTFDSSWRWNYEHVERGGSSGPYTSFWNSAIRWLIRDPELNLVQVEVPREIYAPGERVEGSVRVFRPDYEAAAGVSGRLTLLRRDLDALAIDEREVVDEQEFTADELGRHAFGFELDEPGAYAIVAEADLDDGSSLRDEEILLVVRRSREFRDVEPRPELLAALAGAAGGRSDDAEGGRPRGLDLRPARVEEVNRRRVIDVWNSPFLLALIALVLGVEWSLRRRWRRA